MKALTTVLSVVVLALSFSSCATYHAKYVNNAKGSTAFLQANKKDRARTNVEGLYYVPGWGIAVVNQNADGTLDGLFPHNDGVKGIVSGHTAYIALVDGDWTFYTMILKKDSEGNLVGFYSSGAPFSEKGQKPITMKLIQR